MRYKEIDNPNSITWINSFANEKGETIKPLDVCIFENRKSHTQTMKKSISFYLFLLAAFAFTGCDPGHLGKTFIRNESSQVLLFKYKTYSKDTTITIPAHSVVDVFHFGGLGAGKDYDCCACEFTEISLQPADTSLTIAKNIGDQGNWNVTNENKRRFSNKEITCEFKVAQSDIQ
jgi:hypothetical protein